MDVRNIITSIRLNEARLPTQVVLRPTPITKYYKSGKNLEHMIVYGEAVASTLCMPKIFKSASDAINYRVNNKLSDSWHPYTLSYSDINRPERDIKVIATNAVTPNIADIPKKKASKVLNDIGELHFEYLKPGSIVIRPKSQREFIGEYTEYLVVYGEYVEEDDGWTHIVFDNFEDANNYISNNNMNEWVSYELQDYDCNNSGTVKVAINQCMNIPDWIPSGRIIPHPEYEIPIPMTLMLNRLKHIYLMDERSTEMNTVEKPREIMQLNSTIVVDTTSLEDIEVHYVCDNTISFVNTVDAAKSHKCKVMVPGLGTESMTFDYDDRFNVKLVGPVQLRNCKCHEYTLRPVYNTTITIDNELGETVRFDLSRVTDIEIKAINVDQDTNMYDLLLVIIPKFNPLTLNAIENADDFSKYIYSDNSEARIGFRANNNITTPYKIFGWHVNGSSIVLDVIDDSCSDDKNIESSIINTAGYSIAQLYYELTELEVHRADISYFRITASIHTIADGDIVVTAVHSPLRLCKYIDTNQIFFKIG